MKPFTLYRLEVAPLSILPLARSPFFSYTSPTPVPLGSIISIPFGKQTLEGVVFVCQKFPGVSPSWMKSIFAVLQESFLTQEQCDLALHISEEYFTPLGKVLKHFLPTPTKERKKKNSEVTKKKAPLRATKVEQALLKKFFAKKNTLPFLLDTSLLPDSKKILALLAQEQIKAKKQTLILVPEMSLLPALEARFHQHFPGEEVAVLSSLLSKGAFFSAWERIRTGEAKIILATRQGLFAPFACLGSIIITEEQDESYKQWDMSPRYHGKRAATLLASITHARLLLVSSTPSLEGILALQEKRLLPLIPLHDHSPLGNKITLINLKLERYHKNFSPLSEALVQALRTALTRQEQALLFINRQGLSAFSVCEQCKNVFRCKECDHPLHNTREGSFRCPGCGYTTGLFPSCPTCGHLAFRHVGFGTEKVEKELHKPLPGARVVRLDSTTLDRKTAAMVYEKGQAGKIDILVGTQMILKDPPLPRLSTVAMIDADSLLLFPDFQADERLFQAISRAVRQVKGGSVLLQTFRPESPFFQRITTLGSAAFMEQVLLERQDLFYPPFARVITVTSQGKTAPEVEKKMTTLATALKNILPKGYRLSTPPKPHFFKKEKRFESNLLLRFPHTHSLDAGIQTLLRKNSKDYLIDVDPLTLR